MPLGVQSDNELKEQVNGKRNKWYELEIKASPKKRSEQKKPRKRNNSTQAKVGRPCQ